MARVINETTKGECQVLVNGNVVSAFLTNKRNVFFARPDIVTTSISPDGWRNPTPYFVDSNTYVGPNGTWNTIPYHVVRKGPLLWAMYDEGAIALPADDAGLRSQAEVGALLKLKDQKVNLAQAFAERSQVAGMFAKNITAVATAYRELKKGDIKGAARTLGVASPNKMPRTLANRWLELQYGWKPLLSDVHGAVMEFADRDSVDRYRVSVNQRKKGKSNHVFNPPDLGFSQCPVRMDVGTEIGYHCRLDYLPDNFAQIELTSLGLENPAYIAWELIPFSFVVDWALPIGDWLSSLDAAYGYTFLGGSMTTRRIAFGRYSGAAVDGGLNRSSVTGYKRLKSIRREIYDGSPIPTLPRLKNPWSYAHAANAAALLAQATLGALAPTYGQGFDYTE